MESQHPQAFETKYHLLDLIGAGGMAEVYRCRMSGSMGFEKIIVIKKLLARFTHDSEIVSQFIGEAKLAALLQHENIAHVYDFGEMDGSYFMAMEYLSGKDLYSVLQRAGETARPLDTGLALSIAARICDGMEYAHTLHDFHQRPLQIVHRDLSPHNVFITYDGKVKIIDFGIARAELFDNRTKAGMVKGKLSYMSPEQLTGENVDHRSDIFSIGILLYEMLAGKRMYSGDTAALIRKCAEADYAKLESLVPGLHPRIYAILEKALARDRNDRYASCGQMRGEIEECLFTGIGRPQADGLQTYIVSLFSREFEDEKKGLLACSPKGAQPPHLEDEQTTEVREVVPRGWFPPVRAAVVSLLPKNLQGCLRPARLWTGLLTAALVCSVVAVVLWVTLPQRVPDRATGAGPLQPVLPASPRPPGEAEVETPTTSAAPRTSIENLLAEAEAAVSKVAPNRQDLNIAADSYGRVLKIQPENPAALQGIKRVAEAYAHYGEQALQKNEILEAAAFLHKGLDLTPGDERLSTLQVRLTAQKKAVIQKLADRAEAALQENRLTMPADDSAHKYYRDILKIDGRNALALKGIHRIADRYAQLADEAYRNLNIGRCREYVRQGLALEPGHPQLLQLQKDLTRSKPGMFFKSVEKSFRPIFQ